MRRNLKSICKYIFLASVTVISTTLLFKFFHNEEIENDDAVVLPVAEFHDIDPEILKNERIDWHDYKLIDKDKLRVGNGEQGSSLKLDNLSGYDELYRQNGFNAALSDKIALDRSLRDIRHAGCKAKKYLKRLPSVSIIVPYHNEHWTTLLRTCVSAINRSPPELLKEIILVDDASTKDFLKDPLDSYLAANLTKVRTIHLNERSGLIRARLAGAKAATAEVLIFLDSHTECNVNWLPPLLEPIAQDYRICVCPFIDVIDYETFEYRAQDEGARGGFDWNFDYKRLPLLAEDLLHPTEPFKSPVMAGGLFAITSKFFWELGGYDEGLEIWGGEQYELSFKIWQCGGQMYDAPCSRVGHIYRKYAPFPNPNKGDFVGRNYKRVAKVWMDEYDKYLYMRKPHYEHIDPGDLTDQLAIRTNLKCKPFKWFMETVAFDIPLKYPYVEPPDYGWGEIRNIAAPELCVDTKNAAKLKSVGVAKCSKSPQQNFTVTWHKDIKSMSAKMCLDVSTSYEKSEVSLYPCHWSQGNQYWKYDVEKQNFFSGISLTKCLDCDPGKLKLYVKNCDGSPTQKWRLENVNLTMFQNWDNNILDTN